MRKIIFTLLSLILITWTAAGATQKELEIQGKRLVSPKPPFTLTLPSEFNLVHSFSHENPGESSLTRVYFLVKTKGKQVEEMLILQIADKTNPQAGPMTAPPLKPYSEKRMYSTGKIKKGEADFDHLIQSMAWNPGAPSLQPLIKQRFVIPSHQTLQGQFQFIYQGEHAVLVRYSKDAHLFGYKVSEEGDKWNRDSISGNEKKVYEVFQKTFMEMINSIIIKPL